MTLPHHALRQSAASLFACALLDLFPNAKLMESNLSQIGFTYAFSLSQPLEEGVLTLFEEKMRSLAKDDLPMEALDMMRENAVQLFLHHRQDRKAEIVGSARSNIVPILKIGKSFYDYGQPPYVKSTADLLAFKLQALERVKGEEHVFLLTGTVFPDSKSLKRFLKDYEEAKKSDHRLLGRELGLFAHVDEAGKDGWFWFPKGGFLREALLDWWRREHLKQQFQSVSTPRVVSSSLLRRPGAVDRKERGFLEFDEDKALVNSLEPLHALLFRSRAHSYRELPVRYFECGELRSESSSASCGLFNTSSFTVERAHTFCAEKQVSEELISSLQFIEKTVNILGFEYQWSLCLRGSKYAGTVENWDKVLGWMVAAMQASKCDYSVDASGGAFNGPRMVVRMKDALGREWDGPFIEVDFNHVESFGLRYQGADDEIHAPYMITRSMFGGLERYIAVLVERCGGFLPLWLAQEQVRLIPIAEAHHRYADSIRRELEEAGVRCHIDSRREPLGAKVHTVEREKIPYALILGDAEEKEGVVNVRACSRQGPSKRMKLADFIRTVREEAAIPAST